MIGSIVSHAPIFFLIAIRCFAILTVLPLFSMRAVPRIAKFALAGYMAYLILPHVDVLPYAPYIAGDGTFALEFVLLCLGEGLLGIIIGFYVSIIFSAFSTAGQFFAFQMGFSASSVYDALAQVENPLVGQYLNLTALLVFLQTGWFQRIFLHGLIDGFSALNALSLTTAQETLVLFLLRGLTNLFFDAMVIALPIMGTLLLVNVTMGILSRAAPAMNLLSEGFPTMILLSFFLLVMIMPQIIDFFGRAFATGLTDIQRLFSAVNGGGA